jgi:hypothetical protein
VFADVCKVLLEDTGGHEVMTQEVVRLATVQDAVIRQDHDLPTVETPRERHNAHSLQ